MEIKQCPPFAAILMKHSPDYTQYEKYYKQFHQNAELSWRESETAEKVISILKSLSTDLEIITGIGGHGLVAILRNGPGTTLLLRADMDALPVQELTDLDYACKKTMLDDQSQEQPVMHACGHDMHLTALLATADTLLSSRREWTGTVIFLFQQAEEKVAGARAMVEAGLFTSLGCPIPDVLFSQHVYNYKAGTVATRLGPIMAGTDGMIIKVYGRGGHGSSPHLSVDPVVLASSIVMRLQTIVSREVPPGELAVVTVGSLHVGSAENIISDEAFLKVNTRSVSAKWKVVILDAIKRIVRAECEASGSPSPPVFIPTVSTVTLYNDEAVTKRLSRSFAQHFGADFDPITDLKPASEDFNQLALAIDRPYCLWFIGAHDEDDWERREGDGTLHSVPMLHSPHFAPAPEKTLRTGVEAMVVAALTYLSE